MDDLTAKRAVSDARRSLVALRQMIDAHEGVMQAVALGLPVPDTAEEISYARMAVGWSRRVVTDLSEAA